MSSAKEHKDLAVTLRKVAKDLSTLKEKKKTEKLEKCAAIVLAKVGLNELEKNLTDRRR